MDQATQEALERAKEKLAKVQEEKNIQPDKEVKKEPKEPKEQKSKKEENKANPKLELKKEGKEIVLGKEKIIHITPWKGRTKKEFRKIFSNINSSNIEELDFNSIMDILVYDCVQEDVYLNEGETEYILSEIKKISLNDTFRSKVQCNKCANTFTLKGNIDDVVDYKENKLPHKYSDKITFVDIPNKKELEKVVAQIIENENYDGITTPADIEKAMHIKINDGKEYTVNEVIEYLDNVNLNELQNLIESLNDVLPKCEMKKEDKCPECGNKQTFDIDITEEIFETLLQ